MERSLTYKKALALLLPRGPADFWEVRDEVTEALLGAVANELARFRDKADSLLDEADPTTSSTDTLAAWERIYSLTPVGSAEERLEKLRFMVFISLGRVTLEQWIKAKGYVEDSSIIHRDKHVFTRCGDLIGNEVSDPAMKNVVYVDKRGVDSSEKMMAELELIKPAHINILQEDPKISMISRLKFPVLDLPEFKVPDFTTMPINDRWSIPGDELALTTIYNSKLQ